MSTDKILLEALKGGYHGDLRITPIQIGAVSRSELPPGGQAFQLKQRKSIMIQNASSGTVFVGDESVGYGPLFGGKFPSTCSGIEILAGATFSINCGRSRFYVFNGSINAANIKLLEIA